MGISEDTVLSRAKREGWTQQIRNAKTLAPRQRKASAVAEAAAVTMKERGERHIAGMAGTVDKIMETVQGLDGAELLQLIERLEKFDKVARRTYGLSENGTDQEPCVRLALVAQGSRSSPEIVRLLAEWDADVATPTVQESPRLAQARVIEPESTPPPSPPPVKNRPQWTRFKE
jgi:hypothetical protein